MRLPLLSLMAASSLALGGCAYGSLSFGAGYGDYDYYGGGGYYGASIGPYYGGYGYGYDDPWIGGPYFGWYDDYYYPGTGYYVYDRYRRAHRWSDRQRDYWSARQKAAMVRNIAIRDQNWSGFRNRTVTQRQPMMQRERLEQRQPMREDRRQTRDRTPR